MNQLPSILFALGYLLGGWYVIWFVVIFLKQGDVKFAEAVSFYYGIWICFYLPIAIAGTICLTRMSGPFPRRMIVATGSLFTILATMVVSFYLDTYWYVLLVEYFAFGIGFWLILKRKQIK